MRDCLFPSKKKNLCLKIILQAWHQSNEIWYKIEGRVLDTDGWVVGSEFNSCWFTLCRITLGWIGNGWLLRCDGLHSSDSVRSGSWDQSHSLSPTHGSSSPPVSLPRCLAKEKYILRALFAFKCSVPSNVVWWMTRRMFVAGPAGKKRLVSRETGADKTMSAQIRYSWRDFIFTLKESDWISCQILCKPVKIHLGQWAMRRPILPPLLF